MYYSKRVQGYRTPHMPGLGAGLTNFFQVPALTSSFSSSSSSWTQPVQEQKPSTSSFWDPFAKIATLWNQRPQVLKDIKVRLDPTQVAKAAQGLLPPDQLARLIEQARRLGINLNYRDMPISGESGAFGYRMAGINLIDALPYIAGGVVALLVLPRLLGGRKSK